MNVTLEGMNEVKSFAKYLARSLDSISFCDEIILHDVSYLMLFWSNDIDIIGIEAIDEIIIIDHETTLLMRAMIVMLGEY